MVDLLGPDDAGAINALTTTSDVTSPVAGDSWYGDCAGGVAGTGTTIVAKWLNRFMQQVRAAIRWSDVPVANADDYMLSWAMQSGKVNWGGTFGGTANALTTAAPNSPQSVRVGTVVRGVASANNTGATTHNWAGITSGAALVKNDGTACIGGEIATGYAYEFMWDGTSWRIISPLPPKPLFNPFTSTDVGAILIGGNFVSSGGPNPTVGVGEVGTCTTPGANEVLFTPTSGGTGGLTFFDSRSWGSMSGQTWTVVTISQVGPVYGSGGAINVVTLMRTA